MMFDESVKLFIVHNTPGVSQSGSSSAEDRNVRVYEKKRGEEQQCFVIDVYDNRDPLFIYRGVFSRSQFEDIRIEQKLKYNFEKAVEQIVTSIRDTRKTNDEIIQLVMEKNKCSLQLVHRTKHCDLATLTLALSQLDGSDLTDHLLGIIHLQKQKVDAYSSMSSQCAQLNQEIARIRQEYEAKKLALEDDIVCLEMDVKTKDEEIERQNRMIEDIQANERCLQAAYDSKVDEMEQMQRDNEELVAQLDELDYKLSEKLVQSEKYEAHIASLKEQVNKAKSAAEQAFKKQDEVELKYCNLKKHYEKLQESLKLKAKKCADVEREVEDVRRMFESLKTHEGLLEAQLKDMQEKLVAKENVDKEKNNRVTNRIFKSSKHVL